MLNLLKKQARLKAWCKSNVLILIDNHAVIAILTKGRTSEKQPQGPTRRISSLLLAGPFRLLLGWVKSEWNPADGPSKRLGSSFALF